MKQPNGNEAIERLRAEIKRIAANQPGLQTQIARDCDISSAAVSQFLSGSYPGNNQRIADTLSAWIVRYNNNLAGFKLDVRFPFSHTSITNLVYEVAGICLQSGTIGLLTGASGIGKTRSCEEYAAANPGAVIFVRSHLKYNTKDVFADIHKQVGLTGTGSVHRMLLEICSKLDGSKRLIIIDESEHLSASTLDEIRQINDRAAVGVLYVGLDRFRSQLRSMRHEFEYIFNRVRVPAKLGKLTQSDTELLVKSVLPEANGLCKVFYAASGGNARILEMLVFNSTRAAINNEVGISEELINEVAHQLTV